MNETALMVESHDEAENLSTLAELIDEREQARGRERELNARIVAEISRLVALGWSYRQIGEEMGVTAQRVHQLYKNL